MRPDVENPTKMLDDLRWRHQEEAFVREKLDAWTRIRGKLAAFDFTRQDFQRLVRQVIFSRLQKIRTDSPERFARIRSNAEEFPAFNFVREHFAYPLGFPDGFELRVPVSAPPSALRDAEIE